MINKWFFLQEKLEKSTLSAYFRNGFHSFSFPIVVTGPCPGNTLVLSGSTRSFSFMDWISRSWLHPGKSVRPMEKLKSASPEKTTSLIFIETEPAPWPGDIVKLGFSPEEASAPMSCQLAVRWSRDAGGSGLLGAGCEFLNPPDDVVRWFEEYVAATSG